MVVFASAPDASLQTQCNLRGAEMASGARHREFEIPFSLLENHPSLQDLRWHTGKSIIARLPLERGRIFPPGQAKTHTTHTYFLSLGTCVWRHHNHITTAAQSTCPIATAYCHSLAARPWRSPDFCIFMFGVSATCERNKYLGCNVVLSLWCFIFLLIILYQHNAIKLL